MEYLVAFYLIGFVLTSLWMVFQLRDMKYKNRKDLYNNILCAISITILWFGAIPYALNEYLKFQKKDVRTIYNKVRSQYDRGN